MPRACRSVPASTWSRRNGRRQEAKTTEAAEKAKTFEECAQAYIDEHWNTWSEKHRNQWPSSLKRYAYPTIGKLTIAEIKPSHIYELLAPIWVMKRETANRVRGRIETIIAKNVDVDDKDFRNPAELTKQLREKLPRRPKRVVQHHPALPYAEAPKFMAVLSGASGTAAKMLRFLILTACRTNEVVEGGWSEIDGPLSAWRIPAERMKMDQEHVVPLPDPALAILDEMRNGSQGELIFPNPEGGRSQKMRCSPSWIVWAMATSPFTAFDRHSRPGQRNALIIQMVSGRQPGA